MKRYLLFICLLAACLLLSACGGQQVSDSGEEAVTTVQADPCQTFGHTFSGGTVISEPSAGMDGTKEQVCVVCGHTETVSYPAAALLDGNTFTLTIREFTQRLDAIGTRLCPGLTVQLTWDDWSASTELLYNGEPFCVITYYDNDAYVGSPYPESPMGSDKLDTAAIRHVNVLDYVDAAHAPNSFCAIAMTFDPLLTEAEALELAEFLTDTRRDYYGNYLVTAVNGVGYGHAYPVNQMINSGSIAIHAGSEAPELCIHEVEYTFSGDGIPDGYCTKCGAYVCPAGDNWTYLTSMDVLDHSNHSSSGSDIVVGNWEDPIGAVYWNALRFWVIDHPGWTNSEYIEYDLGGAYDTLSGSIVSSVDSDPNAVMRLEIYLDGRLAFTSKDIGYYDGESYILDVSGVGTVRYVCTTDTDAHGYCVATAAIY